VLITGPTGAGKEFLARLIHDAAGSAERAFVAANCGAFTRELLPSELFGSVRGGFTGATDRPGLFAQAHGGTLFLDEIGELPLDQQVVFLRALQEGRVRPVGGRTEVVAKVRLISATLQDLDAAEQAGRMRSDLLGRIAGKRIHLPGLAERREEILSFFVRFLERPEVTIDLAAAEALLRYPWPRNLRQVKELATHVRMMPRLAEVTLKCLPPELERLGTPVVAGSRNRAPSREALEALLKEHRGNVSKVASALGEHRTQVVRWIEAVGLVAEEYRK
jgi:DNA-binding NtrC family response regulator